MFIWFIFHILSILKAVVLLNFCGNCIFWGDSLNAKVKETYSVTKVTSVHSRRGNEYLTLGENLFYMRY